MTDEQTILDRIDAADAAGLATVLLIAADWYEECGAAGRAEGLRWIVRRNLRPTLDPIFQGEVPDMWTYVEGIPVGVCGQLLGEFTSRFESPQRVCKAYLDLADAYAAAQLKQQRAEP